MSAQRGLLTPVKVGALELPNRIVMSPMTRIRAGEGCVPSERMARYYSQRASTGVPAKANSPYVVRATRSATESACHIIRCACRILAKVLRLGGRMALRFEAGNRNCEDGLLPC